MLFKDAVLFMKQVLPRLTSPGEMTLTEGRLPDLSTGAGSSSSMLIFGTRDTKVVRQTCSRSPDAPVLYAMMATAGARLRADGGFVDCSGPAAPRPVTSKA